MELNQFNSQVVTVDSSATPIRLALGVTDPTVGSQLTWATRATLGNILAK